ncbi:MAG: YigZ family protein [Epsilonproteobacteria bacterium]|nr:YigZ family protein [Campylobacterota bacterium]
MNFIDKIYTQTYEVKQSKFIAYLTPYSTFNQTLLNLKLEHPKARHFVTAYRYLNEFNQIIESSSDDGEPKGTSGKPSLMVIQGSDLIECGVIIVRYFGGTKLGTGGLVRAYSEAVNMVINDATFFEYKQMVEKKISIDYTNIRQVEYECKSLEIEIVDKTFTNTIIYTLKASKEEMQKFLYKVDRLIYLL